MSLNLNLMLIYEIHSLYLQLRLFPIKNKCTTLRSTQNYNKDIFLFKKKKQVFIRSGTYKHIFMNIWGYSIL